MAQILNGYAGLTAEQKDYYVRSLLDRLVPELHFAKYGQKRSAPKREGGTVTFRRFQALEPKTAPLSEGLTPGGSTLDVSAIRATVEQYGDYILVTDKLQDLAFDPVLTEAVQLLGESAGQTIDRVVREVVCAGTNVQYAGGKAARADVADKLTALEIKKAVRTLRRFNAKPLEGGFYIGIIDPDTAFDLMGDPLWEDLSKYGSGVNLEKGEVGKLGGVRFVQTTETKVYPGQGAGGADIHATMILGRDAYGVCDIAGASKPEIIVKNPGAGGAEDPLNQRASAGWKALFAAVRLQELAMVRIESGASA